MATSKPVHERSTLEALEKLLKFGEKQIEQSRKQLEKLEILKQIYMGKKITIAEMVQCQSTRPSELLGQSKLSTDDVLEELLEESRLIKCHAMNTKNLLNLFLEDLQDSGNKNEDLHEDLKGSTAISSKVNKSEELLEQLLEQSKLITFHVLQAHLDNKNTLKLLSEEVEDLKNRVEDLHEKVEAAEMREGEGEGEGQA